MKISLSWLRELVDLGDRSPDEIARELTLKTALIEGVERAGEVGPEVVVGRVEQRAKHPNADKLSVCTVAVGDATLEIVCGAANVAAGQTVAVARIGAKLPGGIEIKASKLRGVTSHGMICSERELGLSDDHAGILVLEDGLEPGAPVADVRCFTDVVLDIDNKSITHRPDLWGHAGFARELSAIYGAPLRPLEFDERLAPGRGPVDVAIEAPDLCGRYQLLFVSGAALGGAAPAWMRRRLRHCGVRPISLLVDLSNYVMLELGQPTHAFDRRSIRGARIVARRAGAGEKVTTLDGALRELPGSACAIADAERALAIGGIMGGADSGVRDDTREAAVESAWFDPIQLRRTATALGLRTDASTRFEKSLDPALSERALRRMAVLLREHVPGAQVAPAFAAAESRRAPAPAAIRLRPERCAAKLGIQLSADDMKRCLERLGFGVAIEGGALAVTVPGSRARDVTMEDDLIEEVGRIHGYDQLPRALPRVECRPVELEPVNLAWRSASALLRDGFAFTEVLSYPYADDQVLERAAAVEDAPYVSLRNPLQQTARRLRRSLVPALLDFVDRNVKTVEETRLFECGKVFLPRASEVKDLPYEPQHLGAVIAERTTKKGGSGRLLRLAKGALEALAPAIERPLAFAPFDSASRKVPGFAHPARAARVIAGDVDVGTLAQVHPAVADGYSWQGEVAVFEVDLTRWIGVDPKPARYAPPPRFPAVVVDVSFVGPFTLRYADVVAGLRAGSPLLASVELVDEYTGSPIEPGRRSLTLRLEYRSDERTLADADVAAAFAAARRWLEEQGALIRG